MMGEVFYGDIFGAFIMIIIVSNTPEPTLTLNLAKARSLKTTPKTSPNPSPNPAPNPAPTQVSNTIIMLFYAPRATDMSKVRAMVRARVRVRARARARARVRVGCCLTLHRHMSKTLTEFGEAVDVLSNVFAGIYFVEFVIKITGLGPRQYFRY